MSALLRLLRVAAPYRGRLAVALAAMVVYAAGTAYLATRIKFIFDNVLVPSVRPADVAFVAVQIVVAYLLKGVGSYGSTYLMADVGQRVVMTLRNQLFRHILDQSAAFFSRRTSGQLVSRITNDVGQIQNAVSETIADLTRESLAVVFFAGLLFFYDWPLALVVMTAAPLIVYPLVRLGQRVRRTTRRGQEDLEHVTHLAAEGFTGHRIVKAFGAEPREAQRFAQATDRLYRTHMKVTGAVAALPPLMECIGGLAAAGALWYGAREISEGRLTAGEFSAFLAAAFMMYGPIKKLSRVNASLQQAIAAAERLFELLDTHTEVREKPRAPALARMSRGVEFRGVGFAYDDRPDWFVLRDASFRVDAGQIAAVVGLSGAGKTTLVNLIPRFYDVTEGAILAAALAAHAHEFIARLDGGYDARIGERGQRLSGGQRQRLAIARAILKDSPLLVLDEATSSLDAESEMLVQDALANLMRSRTTFVIAHRLSTVRRADLILVLEAGRIIEVGTHDSLAGLAGGAYAKLYALQVFDDRDRGEPSIEPRAQEMPL